MNDCLTNAEYLRELACYHAGTPNETRIEEIANRLDALEELREAESELRRNDLIRSAEEIGRCVERMQQAAYVLTLDKTSRDQRQTVGDSRRHKMGGLDELAHALYGRDPLAFEWLGGSEAKILYAAAAAIRRLKAMRSRFWAEATAIDEDVFCGGGQ